MNDMPHGLELLEDVLVKVSVELGSTQLALRDVMGFEIDQTIALDRLTDEPLDVLVNGRPIARAEVVAQDGRFALRIIELVTRRGGNEFSRSSFAPPDPSASAVSPDSQPTDAEDK